MAYLELERVLIRARTDCEAGFGILQQIIRVHIARPDHLRVVQKLVDFKDGSLLVWPIRVDRRK